MISGIMHKSPHSCASTKPPRTILNVIVFLGDLVDLLSVSRIQPNFCHRQSHRSESQDVRVNTPEVVSRVRVARSAGQCTEAHARSSSRQSLPLFAQRRHHRFPDRLNRDMPPHCQPGSLFNLPSLTSSCHVYLSSCCCRPSGCWRTL